MASETYHEPIDRLSGPTQDFHRALASLMEELEAVDWYQQRIDATNDTELKRILEHNRDEEKEHAAMLIEWMRRRDVAFSRVLKTYLFTRGDVTALEEAIERGAGPVEPGTMGAGVGEP